MNDKSVRLRVWKKLLIGLASIGFVSFVWLWYAISRPFDDLVSLGYHPLRSTTTYDGDRYSRSGVFVFVQHRQYVLETSAADVLVQQLTQGGYVRDKSGGRYGGYRIDDRRWPVEHENIISIQMTSDGSVYLNEWSFRILAW